MYLRSSWTRPLALFLRAGNIEIDTPVDDNFRGCRLSGSYQMRIKPSIGFKSELGLVILHRCGLNLLE
jgi:hypothetical protein